MNRISQFWRQLDQHHQAYLSVLAVFVLVILGVSVWIGVEVALTAREARAAITEGRVEVKNATGALVGLADPKTGLGPTVTGAVLAEVANWRIAADGQLTEALTAFRKTESDADHQLAAAISILNDIQTKVLDEDTGFLAIAGRAQASVDRSLNGEAGIAPSFAALSREYIALPDQIQRDRRFNGLIDQSIGLIAASKVTAGQFAISSKAFSDRAPGLFDSISRGADGIAGIAQNGKRVTDKLLSPCVGPHKNAVARALARTGCVAKGIGTAGAPLAIGLEKSGVF